MFRCCPKLVSSSSGLRSTDVIFFFISFFFFCYFPAVLLPFTLCTNFHPHKHSTARLTAFLKPLVHSRQGANDGAFLKMNHETKVRTIAERLSGLRQKLSSADMTFLVRVRKFFLSKKQNKKWGKLLWLVAGLSFRLGEAKNTPAKTVM